MKRKDDYNKRKVKTNISGRQIPIGKHRIKIIIDVKFKTSSEHFAELRWRSTL